MGRVGWAISPRPLLVVVAQGGEALASGDSLAAIVPDCSLGSPPGVAGAEGSELSGESGITMGSLVV